MGQGWHAPSASRHWKMPGRRRRGLAASVGGVLVDNRRRGNDANIAVHHLDGSTAHLVAVSHRIASIGIPKQPATAASQHASRGHVVVFKEGSDHGRALPESIVIVGMHVLHESDSGSNSHAEIEITGLPSGAINVWGAARAG